MLDVITCITGTLGFCVVLKLSKNKIPFAVAGGAAAAVIYHMLLGAGSSNFKATFFSMLVISLYSQIIARVCKISANIILLPSTIPLLPGGSLYYTVSYLVHYDKDMFYYYAGQTVSTGLGIALGSIVVSALITLINAVLNKGVKA
ncbi:MAG: threonine/serine exporter family protein [Clostridiales bacterium]|nr:threonine/serine exporter family protein [Clostridiales bacterium]